MGQTIREFESHRFRHYAFFDFFPLPSQPFSLHCRRAASISGGSFSASVIDLVFQVFTSRSWAAETIVRPLDE